MAVTFNPALFPGNGWDRQFCGGSLITPTFIITAAHCLYNNGFTDPNRYSTITGRTDLTTNEGQEISFDTYFVPVDGLGNQLYNPNNGDFDFVMVRLISPSVSPTIKIAGPSEGAVWTSGISAFITGWGTVAEGTTNYPTSLRVGKVAITNDQVCVNDYATIGISILTDTMVCANWPGVDTCQGDSGGPLVVPTANGVFRLVGSTSFGLGCARPNFPGVYGRLAGSDISSLIGSFIFAQTGIDVLGFGALPVSPPVLCKGFVSTIVGTPFRDVINGTSKRDVISGLAGNDKINGRGGNDIICGGSGKDRLFGGSGKDRLFGGSGKDRLVGGSSRDRCNGGSGKDKMYGCESRVN